MSFLNVGGESWEDLALDEGLVHMGHNCNHLELDPTIHEAMIRAIEGDAYRNYTPPYGFDELAALMAADVDVPGTEVMVTQGATEAIYQAMAAILGPGDQTIVSDPGWPHIPNFARSFGSEVVTISVYSPNAGWKLVPEIVRDYVTPRTKLITVIDPLNPLGSCYDEAEIKALCEIAEENDAWLLHDATYRDFAIGGNFPAPRYSDRAVMNISLSKICGFAGLRVGASIAHPSLMARIREYQVNRLGGNWVAQQGAIAAFQTKPKWKPRVLEMNKRNQEAIKACIDTIDELEMIAWPPAANFVAIDVTGTGQDSEAVVRAVLDEGFVIRSGNYTSDLYGPNFVRVTTTVPDDDVRRFCDALPRALMRLT